MLLDILHCPEHLIQ